MIAVLVPAAAVNEMFFSTILSPKDKRHIIHADITAKFRHDLASPVFFGSAQNGPDAHVRGRRLSDHVAHEPDENNRKDQDREIRVEGREIAQRHAAGDDEMASERKDYDGGNVGRQGYRGYEAREQTQDAETQIPGSGIGLHKLVVLNLAAC